MARNTRTWIMTLALLATSCTAAPVIDNGSTTVTGSPTTSTTLGQHTTNVTGPNEMSPGLSSATTVTTVTTEAPDRGGSDPELPAISTDFDLEDLDDLVADLNEVFADFEQSLAEEEGDIFND